MIHVPEGTFLHEYLNYMEDVECPKVYDLICGLWVLSNALGRRVIVDRPRAPVYLNMFVILVSESGIMRKSTSINMAKSLLSSLKNHPYLIENKASPKEIIRELHRQSENTGESAITIVASELAASFGRAAGMGNTVALLTDLYDCPARRDSAADAYSSVPYSFRNVFCGMLAGSTPSWLERSVTPTIIEGGFTSRCYFVVGRQRKKLVPWPSGDRSSQSNVLHALQEVINDTQNPSACRMDLNDTAKRVFGEWYKSRPLHGDAYRSSFESREDGHVLRFAGLFAANERAWLISDDHIRRAIEFVGSIKDFGTRLFSAGSVKTIDLVWIKKVRDVILAQPQGIYRTELTRSVNAKGLRTHELQTLLHIMHELDLVQVYEETFEGRAGRPKTVYKPTVYLQNEKFLAEVIDKLGGNDGGLL